MIHTRKRARCRQLLRYAGFSLLGVVALAGCVLLLSTRGLATFGDNPDPTRLASLARQSRYENGTFLNREPPSPPWNGPRPTLLDLFFGGQQRRPLTPLPVAEPVASWDTSPEESLRVTWLGHSTLWWRRLRGDRHRVYFSGDTGPTPQFGEIGRRFGPFDLVALEIGAFHPAWGDIHLGPDNAMEAHRMLGGGPLLPIHWSTFNLAMHRWDEPIEHLMRLARERGVPLLLPSLGAPLVVHQDKEISP
ncbi:MBL fold metallo-hydrolase [Myxococcus sp. 1LA]